MEEKSHGRKAAARNEAKDRSRVAKVKTGRAGRVARQQWQEVTSRRSRQRAKKTKQASLSGVESSHDLSPKKIVEEKDRWVKVRVTKDSGAAGLVMPETMFPHVKIERKTSPKKFVAANGEQIKDCKAGSIVHTWSSGKERIEWDWRRTR